MIVYSTTAYDPMQPAIGKMKTTKILISIVVVCGALSGYGVAVSTEPDSLGWYLRAIFGSIGAIALTAIFAAWFTSSDYRK